MIGLTRRVAALVCSGLLLGGCPTPPSPGSPADDGVVDADSVDDTVSDGVPETLVDEVTASEPLKPKPYSDLWCLELPDGEVCDGWDNDCDGLVDEDDLSCHCGSLGAPCGEGFACSEEGYCLSPDGLQAYIPGGSFWMGFNAATQPTTIAGVLAGRPYHRVDVPPFIVDAFPVTPETYAPCVEAGVCTLPPDEQRAGAGHPGSTWYDRDTHPNVVLTGVTWYQAQAYCHWRGSRLCSEAEWEKAGRGSCKVYCEPGDHTCCETAMPAFAWGNDWLAGEVGGSHACCLRVSPDEGFWDCSGALRCPDKWPVDASPSAVSAYGVWAMHSAIGTWLHDCSHNGPGRDFAPSVPTDGRAWSPIGPCPARSQRPQWGGLLAVRGSRAPWEANMSGIRCCATWPHGEQDSACE